MSSNDTFVDERSDNFLRDPVEHIIVAQVEIHITNDNHLYINNHEQIWN